MIDFKRALTLAIEEYIRAAKREGTCGIGIDCLRQCVRPPAGGPLGTNAQYYYADIFAECVQGSRLAKGFVIQ